MSRAVQAMACGMVVVAACVEPPGRTDGVIGPDELGSDDCQGPECPTNSPMIDTYVFHELSLDRTVANDQGFRVNKFLIGGQDHELQVRDGQIRGELDGTIVSGAALQGAQLWLERQGEIRVLRIARVDLVAMWTQPIAVLGPEIEAYKIEWSALSPQGVPEWRDLCAAAKLPPGHPDLNRYNGPPQPSPVLNYQTFVFEGERINAQTREIWDYQPTWFNLGCAGHALMKMQLTGHVGAAASLGFETTLAERQTMLRMLSGDYCGTGHPFTVPGMSVRWKDDRYWLPYPTAAGRLNIEARWQPSGAACLNDPRADVHGNDATRARWPNGVKAAILAECPRLVDQPCAGGVGDLDGYHLITANPW